MRTRKQQSQFTRRWVLQALEERVTPTVYTVTNLNNSGGGSLRQAVTFANLNPATDEINFAVGLSGTIVLTSGELTVTDELKVQGPGKYAIVIDGGFASRIFAASGADLTVSDLTLTNASTAGNGGAIFCNQTLSLENCTIYANSAQDNGGAVTASILKASACSFTNNTATLSGGGIYAFSGYAIDCTISGNGAGQSGGGVLVDGQSFSASGSTISNNHANIHGGGVVFKPTPTFPNPILVIDNCTISGNDAISGGGIAVVPELAGGGGVELNVVRSTIFGNTANSGGGVSFLKNAFVSFVDFQLAGSIVAKNSAGTGQDMYANSATLCKFNDALVGVVGDSSVSYLGTGLQSGTSALPLDPGLTSELGDFGGATRTHYPLLGSPAIDAGDTTASVTTDQRGLPRIYNGKMDLGAVEVNPAVWYVTQTEDNLDGDWSFGDRSLREAIELANATPAHDTVFFHPGAFGTGKTITLALGQMSINGSLTISASLAARVTIDADQMSRVFATSLAPIGSVITMTNMALVNGSTAAAGGAIFAFDENLVFNSCVFSKNHTNNSGGAVHNARGNLTAYDCEFTGNSADLDSGAISVGGKSTPASTLLTRCTVGANSADQVGGIRAFGNLSLYSCTVADNGADVGNGGGVYLDGVGLGQLTVRNCTISNNTATTSGGGMYITNTGGGYLEVANSTMTGNAAVVAGGGIEVSGSPALLYLYGAIVSNNAAPAGPDIHAPVTVGVNNSAIGSASGFTLSGANNLPFGTDLKLSPLGNYGGPTLTIRPLYGSPVIDAGSNPAMLATDQRGLPRERGAAPDIGAHETPPPLIVTTNADSGVGSLRQTLTDANATVEPDTILFDPAFFSVPRQIKLLTALPTVNYDVDFIGTTAGNVTITRDGAAPAFSVFSCAVAGVGNVSFSNLTITGGVAPGFSPGGGIFASDDNVTVANCVLTNNSANSGGAIAVGFFGGIITILNSTISGNAAVEGGGINFESLGSLVMDNCTVSANKATGTLGGAGLRAATATIRNSTFSGNTSTAGRGGAIVTLSNATIQNCTITNNSANTFGGGIHRQAGTLSINSTIVAGNKAVTTGNDINSSTTVSANYSLIGIANDGTAFSGSNNKTGTLALPLDPLLAPLANNGGPTQTHALLPSSPCFGAGSNPAGLANDQRGQGYLRVVGSSADIGAFEDELGLVVLNANDSGVGSLRNAIFNANANAGPDTITFSPAIFSTPQVITLTTGQLNITSGVSIVGPGSQLVTVDANKAGRVFNIGSGLNMIINLSGMVIANGSTTAKGGGISVQDIGDKLTLLDCVISGNTAAAGGGIYFYAPGGTLIVDRCKLTGNTTTSSGNGGGIQLVGSIYGGSPVAVVRDTTISGNVASGSGGGIFNGYNGNLLIERSTLSGNKTNNGSGGAVYFNGTPTGGPIVIRNTTISGNTARTSGGGIALAYFGGDIQIQNCTITANAATFTKGGGIARISGSGTITVDSSIVSSNSAPTGLDISSSGTVNVNYSAIRSSNGFTLTGGNNLPFSTDVKLGALANNGGLTQTHALLAGSPCVNAGSNPAMLTTDQRGVGFARSVNNTDIGAFESQIIPTKITSVQVNDGTPQRSRVISLLLTFDQPPVLPGTPANGFHLKRQSDSAVVTLSATPSGNTVTLTFTGGPVDFGSLADGRYTLTALATQIINLDGDGNGTVGDDYALIGDLTNKLFRLFGDSDGDGTVAANDFIQFRLALGGTSSIFDFDNDGAVAASDFIQFRLRFGGSV